MVARVWNARGVIKDEWIRPELGLQFKSQTNVSFGYIYSNEFFGGEVLDGIQRWDVYADTRFSEYINAEVGYESGDFVARTASPVRLGDGQIFRAGVTLQPVARVSLEPSWQWQKLVDPATGATGETGFFEGHITRARLSLQFTRRLFARVVVQYNDFQESWDLEPLLTYRINPFTVFYVGSANRWEDYADDFDGYGIEETERQYFAKFQYLFQN